MFATECVMSSSSATTLWLALLNLHRGFVLFKYFLYIPGGPVDHISQEARLSSEPTACCSTHTTRTLVLHIYMWMCGCGVSTQVSCMQSWNTNLFEKSTSYKKAYPQAE